jgi:hypothetical protein
MIRFVIAPRNLLGRSLGAACAITNARPIIHHEFCKRKKNRGAFGEFVYRIVQHELCAQARNIDRLFDVRKRTLSESTCARKIYRALTDRGLQQPLIASLR